LPAITSRPLLGPPPFTRSCPTPCPRWLPCPSILFLPCLFRRPFDIGMEAPEVYVPLSLFGGERQRSALQRRGSSGHTNPTTPTTPPPKKTSPKTPISLQPPLSRFHCYTVPPSPRDTAPFSLTPPPSVIDFLDF